MNKVELKATEDLVAKHEVELKAKLIAIGKQEVPNGQMEIARLANVPYDAELPVSPIIESVFNVASVEPGEEYDYFVVSPSIKQVYTITNGSVTQTNITADSHALLGFSDYDSEESYIYLKSLLEGRYDPVALRAEDQQEVMDRLEIKAVLDLLIDGAVAQNNSYAFTSGDTKLTFEKIVEMVRSVAKYGTKLVLITGSDVTTDVTLMDFDTDKQREASLAKAGISEWYKVESFGFFEDSSSKVVFASDKALVVAVSDSKKNKPGHFVRRKVDSVAMGQGVVAKDRLIISDGPAKHVGSDRKLAISILTYENFGAVLTNEYTSAVFKRASVYA